MDFISVGENIHCTRTYKVDGIHVKPDSEGSYAVHYKNNGESRTLPIPAEFLSHSDWEAGKVKHCAVAIWQGQNGNEPCKAAGIEYLSALAKRQESVGATYLDINVDEYSTDIDERKKLMEWTVDIVQAASSLPMCIDSSNIDILRSGLAACDTSRNAPMLNSVSLERLDALPLAAEFNAVVIASAAGESDLPTTTDGRVGNLQRLLPQLEALGIAKSGLHVDPLVFPMSTDPANATGFLESVTAIRDTFGPEIHIVAGLSNISFGMPNRKVLNQVFTLLAVDAGADGGIVDPIHINGEILDNINRDSNAFKLAKAALTGEDDFGMNYIMASRDGSMGEPV